MKELKIKVQKNKKNDQLLICLPKKKLDIKDKDPKFLRIRKKDLIY